MKSLTYVEIDIPDFNSPPALTTYRYAVDTRYLPINNDAVPNLLEVKIDPAIISLGEDLGTRATVTATFRNHRHIFGNEGFSSGSYWSKFRGRYGLTLRGYALRVIYGELGQPISSMETRHFIIESTNGPSRKGEFQIIAKDILKFADGDRAQAPPLDAGFLNASITNVATSATLAPAGIGSTYAASGFVAIGGSEICFFTRSGDNLTLTRGQKNTAAVAHNAQDRVQSVIAYSALSPATIINDLFTTYADISPAYIDLINWNAEISTYLNTVYTADICEPTSVAKLVSELIEQVGLAMWWDAVNRKIKMQVLRPISSTADEYGGFNYLADTIEVTEQPEKRLSQVWTYFGKINPLINEDQINNYRSTSYMIDSAAEATYGSSVIKKIFSRWIPDGGRAVADTLGAVLLARFRDPPRRIGFSVLRGSVAMPVLGAGYQITGTMFQQANGSNVAVPAQVTSINPQADVFDVELEEISLTFAAGGGGGSSPGEHAIIIDANLSNVNLRTMHDSIFGTPVSGNVVRCTINTGVTVGADNTGLRAFDVGTWPGGVTLFLIVNGRIAGAGGNGGHGTTAGSPGGTALYTRQAITLTANQLWGGGGGGGGGGAIAADGSFACGGGGGAGKNPGAGGVPNTTASGSGNPGFPGTETAGGAGGVSQFSNPSAPGFAGATGGGPGLAGNASVTAPSIPISYPGGAAGPAVDGISFVSLTAAITDARGPQIN